MGADRDDASLEDLFRASVEARLVYESALEERAQVVINTYSSLPPLRDFGDAALLGRAFPPPSARLWMANLTHPDESEAALFASVDVLGKVLTKGLEKTRLFMTRVRRAMNATRRLDQTIEKIRDAWIARQASNEAAPTREERERDARVARAFEGALHRESTRLADLEEFAKRFGLDDELQSQRDAIGGLARPDAQAFLEAELRDEFRSQRAELDRATAWLASEWRRRHARDLDALHRGEVGKSSSMPVMPYTSLPNPWDWNAATLRAAHRQFVLEVSQERHTLQETVRELSTTQASHELSQLRVFVRHVALRQHELDGLAQSTDDWTEAAQNEVVALQPLKERYEHALEAMVARSTRWQSAWERRTYPYLMTREDVRERVAAEILEPVSAKALAHAVRETERAATERIRLTVRLDALIANHGIELALADALANRCTEALLVREMRDLNPAWPESVQELVDAVDGMLVQPTWRERNHRGARGADEAMDRIYEWVLRLETRQDQHHRQHHRRHWVRAPPSQRPLEACTTTNDENVNDLDRPLLPCTIATTPTADVFSVAGLRKELPTLSVAAATAYRRRWLR